MPFNNVDKTRPEDVFLQHALEDLSINGAKNLCPVRISQDQGIENMFEDADALRIALATQGFIELEECMKQATPATLPFEERLFQACKAYLQMTMENPSLLQLMFGLRKSNASDAPSSLKTAGDKAFKPLEDIMIDAIAKEQLKTKDSRSATLATWSFIHGFSFLMVREGKTLEDDSEELLEMYQNLHRLLSKGLVSERPN